MRLKDQLQKGPVAGAIAIASFLVLQSLLTILFDEVIGPVKCRDGYASSSIGRSGACSSHGGVDRSRDALIAVLSVAVGVPHLIDRRHPVFRNRDEVERVLGLPVLASYPAPRER